LESVVNDDWRGARNVLQTMKSDFELRRLREAGFSQACRRKFTWFRQCENRSPVGGLDGDLIWQSRFGRGRARARGRPLTLAEFR
jgi:hypothetical protein